MDDCLFGQVTYVVLIPQWLHLHMLYFPLFLTYRCCLIVFCRRFRYFKDVKCHNSVFRELVERHVYYNDKT